MCSAKSAGSALGCIATRHAVYHSPTGLVPAVHSSQGKIVKWVGSQRRKVGGPRNRISQLRSGILTPKTRNYLFTQY